MSSFWPEVTLTRPASVKATALPPSSVPKNDMTATRRMPAFGVADRDAMKVAAIELASWNPLVNVKANASRMVSRASSSMGTAGRCATRGSPRGVSQALYCAVDYKRLAPRQTGGSLLWPEPPQASRPGVSGPLILRGRNGFPCKVHGHEEQDHRGDDEETPVKHALVERDPPRH